VWLRSFWHHFHVHPTTGWTAVVYCYPQDNGALASIDLRENYIPSEQEATIKTICNEKNITLQL
jgi:hypothetical protein